MPNFIDLPPFSDDGDLHVVVETPRGSRAKFAHDPKLRAFTLTKSLLTGLTYPHDWGFVPSTKADDGDPIDIMVIHDAATTFLFVAGAGLGRPHPRASGGPHLPTFAFRKVGGYPGYCGSVRSPDRHGVLDPKRALPSSVDDKIPAAP